MLKNTIRLCFIGSFFLTLPVWAQGHDFYCEKAESTAALQKCLTQHLKSAQDRLNKIYQDLSAKQEGEDAKTLAALQQQWLNYRDAECTWEASRPNTPALKRTNELSCMARVTDDRADILSTVLMDATELTQVREYGSFPRWMNVAAKGKSSVFWDYRNRMSADLNCDGEQEKLMWGVSLDQVQAHEGADSKLYNTSVTIAIGDNPATGKPSVQYITLPVLGADGVDNLCDHNIALKVVAAEESKEAIKTKQDSEEKPVCQTILQVNDKKCSAKSILWTGKTYALEIKQEEYSELEKEKNE
ncbi:MAG: DUF1311 domain-containing protein [Alphaproteobacteria bacterium]|nr:DUF1311 domain-containing protein [Alphaproteobacteria bacterium]NCQ88503.1 DUF1311 domain-containing protein [Alphaproteobacteria bacterium]NCT06046.1 DUF1311 domain-containing protein [Alphaproteobacteria bacterium]